MLDHCVKNASVVISDARQSNHKNSNHISTTFHVKVVKWTIVMNGESEEIRMRRIGDKFLRIYVIISPNFSGCVV